MAMDGDYILCMYIYIYMHSALENVPGFNCWLSIYELAPRRSTTRRVLVLC